ncbi:gluconeogenesis transcription factor RDS2 [Rhodotorula paludigena]|uniref:gluconeogenesis transcription factor RDS2 n=1 Tax=Rhodotorula paludigena TaxID=86838 RepID=UPI00317BF769
MSTSYQAIAPAAPTPVAPRPISNPTPSAPGSSTSGPTPPAAVASTSSAPAPPPAAAKKKRRSKVDSACRFCRRSHMQCSGERPCQRCIKREIAHLCTDEPLPALDGAPGVGGTKGAHAAHAAPPPPPAVAVAETEGAGVDAVGAGGAGGASASSLLNTLGLDMGDALGSAAAAAGQLGGAAGTSSSSSFASFLQGGGGAGGAAAVGLLGQGAQDIFNAASQAGQQTMFTPDFNLAMLDLANDGLGAGLGLDMTSGGEGEFHGLGLSEFLQSLNDAPLFASSDPSGQPGQIGGLPINDDTGLTVNPPDPGAGTGTGGAGEGAKDKVKSTGPSVPGSPINKTERFLLTAADQKDGSRSDRLARVIHAKFEAGLLRPYNHVAGYTRLMKWMADNMSASSRQRTLHTLSEFRPTFRAIASGLTDLDLVFIEEAFERLLLDYDRVFSSMGIPSCLWRRTGEIYKGNKEFAALVGVPIEHLQGGKLAIYELMAEESAVNYWEKYGNIAFDVGQKAVLTSCVLINQSILSRKRKKAGADKGKVSEDAMVNACFSFTIRRDSYGIPSMIVGNFIRL